MLESFLVMDLDNVNRSLISCSTCVFCVLYGLLSEGHSISVIRLSMPPSHLLLRRQEEGDIVKCVSVQSLFLLMEDCAFSSVQPSWGY